MARLALLSALLLALSPAARCGPLDSGALKGDDVVIVDFDTLRADGLHCLGNPRPVSPRVDAFASGSYLFTQAVSQAPWTLPSTMSYFTSLYPHQHGMTNKFALFTETRKEEARLPRRFVTLAQVFKQAGYETAAFTGDAGVEGRFGFSRGFDVYYDGETFAGFETTFPMALAWLKAHPKGPHFLFIHGYDVHGQYRGLGPGSREKEFLALRMKTIKGEPIKMSKAQVRFWRGRYDRQVLRADGRFGRFWDELSKLPSSKRTVVLIIADHGDQFYEHGGFDHGMTLYDELLRVPLIVRVPGQTGRRVAQQVRAVDVMPTLVDWLGLPASPALRRQMQGRSLLPLLRGKPLALDALSETSFLLQAEKRSLRTPDGWKLILDLETLAPQLYDLRVDPEEHDNLADARPALTKQLSARLLKLMQSPAPR